MYRVYVDDTILVGPDLNKINEEIKSLRVSIKEQSYSFQLKDEGQVGDFLRIRREKLANHEFYLTQTGRIDEVLSTSKMGDCNLITTPVSTENMQLQ